MQSLSCPAHPCHRTAKARTKWQAKRFKQTLWVKGRHGATHRNVGDKHWIRAIHQLQTEYSVASLTMHTAIPAISQRRRRCVPVLLDVRHGQLGLEALAAWTSGTDALGFSDRDDHRNGQPPQSAGKREVAAAISSVARAEEKQILVRRQTRTGRVCKQDLKDFAHGGDKCASTVACRRGLWRAFK